MEIPIINFVLRSKNRLKVLKSLEQITKTNSLLAREIKTDVGNMRKLLLGLQQRGLIICKNPQDFHFKQYELSDKGKEILSEIAKLEEPK